MAEDEPKLPEDDPRETGEETAPAPADGAADPAGKTAVPPSPAAVDAPDETPADPWAAGGAEQAMEADASEGSSPDLPPPPEPGPDEADPWATAAGAGPQEADPTPTDAADERTIWAPAASAAVPPPPSQADPEEGKTVWVPPTRPSAAPPPPPAPPTAYPDQTVPPGAVPHTSFGPTQFAPREPGRSIQVGDVLNHIFEVRRFIARGGMGEVFEGVNVNSEERVAIKVMLPQLAADPNVINMFRKEARTLTRLSHEALVQYRVLAQEPQLGVLYIVTDYIEGSNLADVLATLKPSPEDQAMLLRRLASGLRVAHALGAIHRDISPDNVLLENGRLDQARIIDFGIAKDTDPGSATIVGDGFAGKLNYVAPEQLGDFNRSIGPWTDVYSLGLVMLAVILGRNVNMGGSLVDAVDKRRAGPDLSDVPDRLRPTLEKMLVANPEGRLQSMDAVVAALDGTDSGAAAAGPQAPPVPKSKAPLFAGVALAVLLLLGAGWYLLGRGAPAPATGGGTVAEGAAKGDPVEVARNAIDSALPSVSCTWLAVTEIGKAAGGLNIGITGVAGNPASAQNDLGRSLAAAGAGQASLDFEDVAPITPAGCSALDTYRQIRDSEGQRLSVPQRKFEMRMQDETMVNAGKLAANAVVELNLDPSVKDFTLIGLEPSGLFSVVIPDRKTFESEVAQFKANPNPPIAEVGNGRYRLNIDLDHEGWSGILLVTGTGPFDAALVAPGLGGRGPDWQNKFISAAAEKGWKTEMVWFRSQKPGGQ